MPTEFLPLGFSCNATVERRRRRGFRAERNGNRVVSKAFFSHVGDGACGRVQRRRAIPTGVELRPSTAAAAAVTCAISVFAVLPFLPVTPAKAQRPGVRSFVLSRKLRVRVFLFLLVVCLYLFHHSPAGFRRLESFEFGSCRGDGSEPAVLVVFFSLPAFGNGQLRAVLPIIF